MDSWECTLCWVFKLEFGSDWSYLHSAIFAYNKVGIQNSQSFLRNSTLGSPCSFSLERSAVGLSSQSYGYSSRYVRMWELDHKESWALKNWCFQTVVLKKTLESPLDSKEIKSVNPKGNQPWIFLGRTDAEVVAPILWPPDVKSWLIGKEQDWEKTGRNWGQEEKAAEDEMVCWHLWLNGHGSEQTLGDGKAQGNLACYSHWGCKELDTTEQLNNDNIGWHCNLPSSVFLQIQLLLHVWWYY